MPVQVRTNYGERIAVKIDCGEGRTKQAFKDECDINRIVSRYVKTGEMPPAKGGGVFADVSRIGTLLEARKKLADAEAKFKALPSAMRSRFKNDAGELLRFLANPKNLGEARELGLVAPEVVQEKPAGKSKAGDGDGAK